MEADDIDVLLRSERSIEPSAGFVGSVMDAVRRDAMAPAPLEFPWRRALPGLALGAIFVVAAAVYGGSALASAPVSVPGGEDGYAPRVLAWFVTDGRWVYLAVLGSLFAALAVVRPVDPASRSLL